MGRLNMDWDLKPVHEAVLRVFKSFEAICANHNFRYYAMAGTALGAVRHKGFIPWDDDLDVMMPRDDYNRFVEVVQNELPACYRFARGGNHALAPIHFGRIYDATDGIVDDLGRRSNLQLKHPPFIDIFILEGFPTYTHQIASWWRMRKVHRLCQLYRFPETAIGYGLFKKLVCRTAGFFVSMFYPSARTNEEMMTILDKKLSQMSFDEAFMVVEPAFFRFRTRRIMPKDYFEPGKRIPFEDSDICVPAKVEEYLTRIYGDYMRLPPLEQRIPEHSLGYLGGSPVWDPE